MRFQKEVYEKYRTCSAKGKHIDARTPRYDRFQCPDELTAMLRPGKRIETEELGIMEIPVSKRNWANRRDYDKVEHLP